MKDKIQNPVNLRLSTKIPIVDTEENTRLLYTCILCTPGSTCKKNDGGDQICELL